MRALPQPAEVGAFERLRRLFAPSGSSSSGSSSPGAARGGARPLDDVDVLYIHGWSDYFFQTALAHYFTARGARFFALDLRKYGRSLRPGQTPGYIEDLAEYDAEIGRAIGIIEQDRRAPRRLLLFGHSTGGLILTLWANRHPGAADGLLLNSPWLEFQLARAGRQLITPLVNLTARLRALDVAPQLDFGYYTRAQREVGLREDFATVVPEWRPERAHGVRAGWMKAILAGHDRVALGLDVRVPALTVLSRHSDLSARWREKMIAADTVLEVDAVARAALGVSDSMTIERVDGALHDVFLSAPVPRAAAYAALDRWFTGWAAAVQPTPDPGE